MCQGPPAIFSYFLKRSAEYTFRPRKVDTPPLHSHRPPGDGHTVSAKVASKRSSHRPLRSGHTTPVQREGVQPPPTLGGHTDPVQPSPTRGGHTVHFSFLLLLFFLLLFSFLFFSIFFSSRFTLLPSHSFSSSQPKGVQPSPTDVDTLQPARPSPTRSGHTAPGYPQGEATAHARWTHRPCTAIAHLEMDTLCQLR